MKIRLEDPSHTATLAAFLRRCDCAVEVTGLDELDANPIDDGLPDELYYQLELRAYLRVWEAIHPDARADLVGA